MRAVFVLIARVGLQPGVIRRSQVPKDSTVNHDERGELAGFLHSPLCRATHAGKFAEPSAGDYLVWGGGLLLVVHNAPNVLFSFQGASSVGFLIRPHNGKTRGSLGLFFPRAVGFSEVIEVDIRP